MAHFERTGEFKAIKGGLVDQIADGYIERNGERIPCVIGYYEDYDDPVYLFIEDGITSGGTHYYAETIEL